MIVLLGNAISSKPLQAKENKIESDSLQTDSFSNISEDYYLIGPGDVLSLQIYDAEEFSGDFNVLNDGTIHLPLVGSVFVSNLSLNQSSDKIKNLYKNQLLRPDLYLGIKKQRNYRKMLNHLLQGITMMEIG